MIGKRVSHYDVVEAVHEGTLKRPFNQNSVAVNPVKVFVPIRQASVLAQLKALGGQ